MIIINENWYKKYLKTRTKVYPKEFVKSKISHFNIKDYFDHHDMYSAICEYNRIKKKTKNEYSLYDLINNSIK